MLSNTIERAYEIFSSYQVISPLDVCTECCMDPRNAKQLALLPVREIAQELLSEYNDGARPTKTSLEEVKHFLPRYLDLIAQFKFPTHSVELSLVRLMPFDIHEWTEEELNIIRQFAREFFKHCLSMYPLPAYERIDSIIIMFGTTEFDILDILSIWEEENTPESILHLRDLYFHGFGEYNGKRLISTFAGEELSSVLVGWTESEKVKQHFAKRIEKLIIENNKLSPRDLWELNLLYEILQAK